MRGDIDGAVFKFIVIPVIYLMGIIVVGSIIQDVFHLPGAVTGLFEAAGGITGLALYFRANLMG